MTLILSIPKGRADEIIHREITKAFRTLKLYCIIQEMSPPYCKFPDSANRELDLDYQNMQVQSDYAIGADTTIAITEIAAFLPITVYEYQGMHPTNPYARPGGGPVFNFPKSSLSHIEVRFPGSFDLDLWEPEHGIWEGHMLLGDFNLDESMVKFVNK